MINDVIKPGYAELKSEWLFQQTASTSGFTPPQG
jgi:adenosine deaminase